MANKNFVGTTYGSGYTILEQGNEAVLAKKSTQFGDEFVAWHYNITEEGRLSCYWGRYGTEEYARECYHKKENGIYSGD